MKKYILAALAAALSCIPAFAQNPTNVTGTLTDPSSVAYYPAQVTACLTPVTIDPTVGGKHVNPNIGANYCIGPVQTAPNGAFSMALYANGNITPGATQWIFTVQTAGSGPPAGKGAQTFSSAAVTVSGTSQDVSTNINSVGPAQLNTGSSSSSLSSVFDATASRFAGGIKATTQVCMGPSGVATITNASKTVTCFTYTTPVSGAVAANVATLTLGTLPTGWAAGNTIVVSGFSGGDTYFNGTFTVTGTTSTTLTFALVHANASSTTTGQIINQSVGPFTQAMATAAWEIEGTNGCCGVSHNWTGTVVLPESTIASVSGSTSATVSGAAATAGCSDSTCILVFGPLEDAAGTAIDNAMIANPNCVTVLLPVGLMWFNLPHFNSDSVVCKAGPGVPTLGDTLDYSPQIQGWGPGSSVIFHGQLFDFTKCVFGPNGIGCDLSLQQVVVSNIGIWGGGNGTCAGAGTHELVAPSFGSQMSDVALGAWCGGNNSITGVEFKGIRAKFVSVDGFGGNCVKVDQQTSVPANYFYYLFAGDCNNTLLNLGSGKLYDYGSQYGVTPGATAVLVGSATTYEAHGVSTFEAGSQLTGNNGNAMQINGGTVNLYGGNWDNKLCSGNCNGIQITAGGTLNSEGSSATGSGTGKGLSCTTGTSTYNDMGNNNYIGWNNVTGCLVIGSHPITVNVASRNTNLGATTLLPSTTAALLSSVSIYAYDSAAGAGCVGNTTVVWTVSYTDLTGSAQTSTATETIVTNGGTTGADALKVTLPISSNFNTAVTVSTVVTPGGSCSPTPSYAARVTAQ